MRVRKKQWEQFIPKTVEEVWSFFAQPDNLNALTPEDLSFEILSEDRGIPMYPGMIIQYRIGPFPGIRMNWVTEITQVQTHTYFIDEQRFGPYAFWHHQHWFKPVEGGVQMTDLLHYKIPYGPVGTLVDKLVVEKRIEEIFRYRARAIEKIFSFYT